jgi:hypothetical protein
LADPKLENLADSTQAILMPMGVALDEDQSRSHERSVVVSPGSLPCVIYESDLLFKIKRISSNTKELLHIEPASLLGTTAFCQEYVFRDDLEYLSEKLHCLSASGNTSFVHRVRGNAGLPIWVAHSLRRIDEDRILVGCIVPLPDYKHPHNLDLPTVSRFIHKLGNYLQILTLLSNSLRKQLPMSKDAEELHQTIEMLIELTRGLSDYSQEVSKHAEVDFEEVLTSVINSKKMEFFDKEISFDIGIGESVHGLMVRGDAYLLDFAIGNVLQNALEATGKGGRVSLTAEGLNGGDKNSSVLQICVLDSGCGIAPEHLSKVVAPYFTTKKNHDGLGLSMASRFIEMHGGLLTIESPASQGVNVAIVLPAGPAGDQLGE